MGRAKSIKRQAGRAAQSPEGLAEEEQRPLVGCFGQPLRLERLLRLQSPSDGLSDRKAWPKTLLPTPTPRLRLGIVGTLLTALLR